MRIGLTAVLLAGLCAIGLTRRALASRLGGPLPPRCATRIEVRGPEGFDLFGCAADLDATLRAAGRSPGCPATGALRDGARLNVFAGECRTDVDRMAGPALRLLRLPIDINLSSVEDLQALPGIGPGLAARLVAARPYRTTSELRQVPGIGTKRLAELVGAAEITTSR